MKIISVATLIVLFKLSLIPNSAFAQDEKEFITIFGVKFSCSSCELFQDDKECTVEMDLQGKALSCKDAFQKLLNDGKIIGSRASLGAVVRNSRVPVEVRNLAFSEALKDQKLEFNFELPDSTGIRESVEGKFNELLTTQLAQKQKSLKIESLSMIGSIFAALAFVLLSFIAIKQLYGELSISETTEISHFELPRLLEKFGLPLNASCEDLRKSFSKLAIELNPDRSPENTAEFREAYADFRRAKELLKGLGR